MQVRVSLFPATYMYSFCDKHNCRVLVRFDESKPFMKDSVIGGQLVALSCEIDGSVEKATCTDSWVLEFDAGHTDIVIKQ